MNSHTDGPSRRAIATALVAATFASVGDFGLLYVGQQAGEPALAWPAPPAGTLALSQWLGAFTIPLYAVGYISLSRGLGGRARTIVFWLGIYTSGLGGIIHGLTGLAILGNAREGLEAPGAFAIDPAVVPFLLPFVGVVVLGLLIASVAWTAAVLRGRSRYPRSFGYLSPLACIGAVILVGLPFDFGQRFLVPMAPNLGSMLFFAVTLRLAERQRT